MNKLFRINVLNNFFYRRKQQNYLKESQIQINIKKHLFIAKSNF
jgi:hypothetical protein